VKASLGKGKIMKKGLFVLALVGISFVGVGQNTVTSGNWSDPSVWSAGIPGANSVVNVSNPLTIDQNITITTGTYNFGYNGASAVSVNVTDPPVGTAYTLTSVTSGGSLIIWAGTTTFEGAASIDNSTLWVKAGATLVVGPLTIANGTTVIIDGTLIVNGDFTNNNNGGGTMTVSGTVIVNGNYSAPVGSVALSGSGTFTTTGTIITTGSSAIFGQTNNCTVGPCSGTTLTCTFTNTISPTSKTICSSSTAGTLTANTNATTPSYQWLSSTDNTTYSNASGTSTNSTYVTPTLTLTTWYKVQITVSGPTCISTSAATKVTVLSGGGWIGGTSNDWGTAANWCSGVPTSTTDVTISNASGVAFMPSVNAGTAAMCRNLTINNTFPASSVSIAASATASLSIYGDFTNNGTFTDGSTAAAAGAKFVGAIAQTIAGSTANVFNNLTFNNTSGATPAINITTNNVTVNSNLTMTAALVNLNGYTITLGTTAASTGTLAYTAGTRFYGGNIERWFPTSSITIPAVAGQFPIGTSTDYRPIYFGNAGLSAGGTIKIRHTAVTGSTAVSPTFVDNLGTVALSSNSFWTVSTANIIGTGTHNLRTEGTGFGTVGAVTDLRQTLVNTIAPGTDGAHAGTTLNPQVNRTGLTTANLSNNFYWGSINSVATPLPISLISFSGQQLSDQIKLSWKTASELNFSFFSLEKSLDGKEFSEIAQLPGHGTTQEEHNYQSVDKAPLIGKNYYRLKSIDLDGQTEYFSVISIDFSKEKQFYVYPNPTNGESITVRINFNADEQQPTLAIYDNLGVIIGRYDFNQSEATIQFPSVLSSGIYYAKFSSPSLSRVVRFVVK
jgi:hypothetical protein